jgi:hypothetical protein
MLISKHHFKYLVSNTVNRWISKTNFYTFDGLQFE